MFDTFPASSTLVDGIYERYTKEDFLSLLDTQYGITDNVYEYVGPQEYNIKNITWYEDTETAENLLPDNYVYTKIGNTNIKRIIEMYMRLIGVFKNEVIQVANNYNYKKIQDKTNSTTHATISNNKLSSKNDSGDDYILPSSLAKRDDITKYYKLD